MVLSNTGVSCDVLIREKAKKLTDFMDGGDARVCWDYTAERKRRYGSGRIES